MNCPCHDAPAYWQKDARLKAGGRWECPVRRWHANQRRNGNLALLERRRENWAAPDGGYIRRRKRELARLRTEILARLAELEQEAEDSCLVATPATRKS